MNNVKTIFDFHGAQMNVIFDAIGGAEEAKERDVENEINEELLNKLPTPY